MLISRLFLSLLVTLLTLGRVPVGAFLPQLVPTNIIVMIGDGMGYNQTLAASYYGNGASGAQVYNTFPIKFAVSTYPYGESYNPALAWADFNYVKSNWTDSAAAATAMATGVKTPNGRIGMDHDGYPLLNVFEAAELSGKSSGIVTSVPISHATPAGFIAHNISRSNIAAIANEMILNSGADVIMGAGHPLFSNSGQPAAPDYEYVGGQATWEALVAGQVNSDRDNDGEPEVAALVQELSQFRALMSGVTPEFVVGLAQVAFTLQQERAGDALADPYVVPFNANVPTLEEMSLAAINVLDNNPRGFILMIEGGAIDKAAGDGQKGRMVEEQISFDQAVEAVVTWVEANSSWAETLLVVTGDHETGYLWGPGSNPAWIDLLNFGSGMLPGMQFYYYSHTNSLVPLYARGEAAQWFTSMIAGQDPKRGYYVDNTSIARVIFGALNPYRFYFPIIVRTASPSSLVLHPWMNLFFSCKLLSSDFWLKLIR